MIESFTFAKNIIYIYKLIHNINIINLYIYLYIYIYSGEVHITFYNLLQRVCSL